MTGVKKARVQALCDVSTSTTLDDTTRGIVTGGSGDYAGASSIG